MMIMFWAPALAVIAGLVVIEGYDKLCHWLDRRGRH